MKQNKPTTSKQSLGTFSKYSIHHRTTYEAPFRKNAPTSDNPNDIIQAWATSLESCFGCIGAPVSQIGCGTTLSSVFGGSSSPPDAFFLAYFGKQVDSKPWTESSRPKNDIVCSEPSHRFRLNMRGVDPATVCTNSL